MWFDMRSRQAAIMLKTGADAETQLKSWCHAIRIASVLGSGDQKATGKHVPEVLKTTLEQNQADWNRCKASLENAGWNLAGSSLDAGAGSRFQAHVE